MKRGKRIKESMTQVDRLNYYPLDDALEVLHKLPSAKFDESVDCAIRLGVDPRHADQMVRSTVVLPNGTGKTVRVLVFAKGEHEKKAQDAGADYVGAEELAEKIQGGWFEFDIAIATPDMMKVVGKLGKALGPRGIMPSPKSGTVTFDVEQAIKDAKAGKIEFRVDKAGNLHVPVGKKSFAPARLRENIIAVMDAVMRAKPSSSKGTYVKGITLSSTMGPGIKIDRVALIQSLTS